MITFLSSIFIKNPKDYQSPAVRQAYGVLCGGVGIALNLVLFLGKWIAGMISGSIAITADAFNNLSDAGSSIITLVGFKLSGQKPDPEHPFGHGRMEYISGLFVSHHVSRAHAPKDARSDTGSVNGRSGSGWKMSPSFSSLPSFLRKPRYPSGHGR